MKCEIINLKPLGANYVLPFLFIYVQKIKVGQ